MSVDGRRAARLVGAAVAAGAVAAATLTASLVMVGVALARLLERAGAADEGAAELAVGAVLALAAVAIGWAASASVGRSTEPLRRSVAELKQTARFVRGLFGG